MYKKLKHIAMHFSVGNTFPHICNILKNSKDSIKIQNKHRVLKRELSDEAVHNGWGCAWDCKKKLTKMFNKIERCADNL